LSHSPSCLSNCLGGVGREHRAPEHGAKDLHVAPCRYARSEAKVTSTPVREPFYVRSRLAVPSNASLTFLALGWIAIGVYFLLPSYPFLLAGIFLLLRDLGSVRTRVAVLDAVIVTIAAGTVQWILFVGPYLHTSLQPFARGVEMTYPTMDLLLFVALAQLMLGVGIRTIAYQLLVLSVGLWIVGDELFGLSVDNYTAGGWLDIFWLGSYVFWGAAGLEPSANHPPTRDRREVPRLTRGRV